MIDLNDVGKIFDNAAGNVSALRGVNLHVMPGEYVAITGPSGSGKSTLMNIIACLTAPTSGRYLLDGIDVTQLDDDAVSAVRSKKTGFVFQSFNLLPRLNVFENVELPLLYTKATASERKALVRQALDRANVLEKERYFPADLSGGQQQRVAIARALVNGPSIILADEPTGNLDSASGLEILRVFEELNDSGLMLVIVTHDESIARRARRRVSLLDGKVVEDAVVGAV